MFRDKIQQLMSDAVNRMRYISTMKQQYIHEHVNRNNTGINSDLAKHFTRCLCLYGSGLRNSLQEDKWQS